MGSGPIAEEVNAAKSTGLSDSPMSLAMLDGMTIWQSSWGTRVCVTWAMLTMKTTATPCGTVGDHSQSDGHVMSALRQVLRDKKDPGVPADELLALKAVANTAYGLTGSPGIFCAPEVAEAISIKKARCMYVLLHCMIGRLNLTPNLNL